MVSSDSDRNAFLVLGMHRGGTSAVAGTLNRLGLSLPTELMKPNPLNPRGYFESWDLVRLDNRILHAAATGWDDWSPIADAWFNQTAADGFADQIVAFLKREFAVATGFVIKDPRMCRLVPVWLDALGRFGTKPWTVLPIRHPDAVARSLMARDGISPANSHLLWLRHMLDAERATRELPRVFVDYDALLDDWRTAIDWIGSQLRFHWPLPVADASSAIDAFLDPRLRHHGPAFSSPAGAGRAKHLIGPAWETFTKFAHGEDQMRWRSGLDALREELGRIPSAYRLPLGLGVVAAPIGRLWSRLRPKQITALSKGR